MKQTCYVKKKFIYIQDELKIFPLKMLLVKGFLAMVVVSITNAQLYI